MAYAETPGSKTPHAQTGQVYPFRINRISVGYVVEQCQQQIVGPGAALGALRGYDNEGKIGMFGYVFRNAMGGNQPNICPSFTCTVQEQNQRPTLFSAALIIL